MPENQQTPQTVDLSSVNAQPKTEGFFDRMMKKSASFIAKVTWQPDPQTWVVDWVSQDQSIQQSAPVQPEIKKEVGFFDKLVASTQGLLAKTQGISESIVAKTQSISNTVVEKTTSASQMIQSAPGNLANKVSEIANQTSQTAQNLASQATQTVGSTLQKTQEVWSNIVNTSTQAVSNVQAHATDFVANPIQTVQNGTQTIVNQTQSITAPIVNQAWGMVSQMQSSQLPKDDQTPEQKQGFLEQINQGLGQVIQKTQDVWSGVIANTKDFVQNPMEKIDNFAGAGVPQAPIQTETANTTALDNLTQGSQQSIPDLDLAPQATSQNLETQAQSESIIANTTESTSEVAAQTPNSIPEVSKVAEQEPQTPDIIPGVYQ